MSWDDMVNDLDEDGCEFTVNARLAREAIKLFALGQALHLMGHALHLILDECVWYQKMNSMHPNSEEPQIGRVIGCICGGKVTKCVRVVLKRGSDTIHSSLGGGAGGK